MSRIAEFRGRITQIKDDFKKYLLDEDFPASVDTFLENMDEKEQELRDKALKDRSAPTRQKLIDSLTSRSIGGERTKWKVNFTAQDLLSTFGMDYGKRFPALYQHQIPKDLTVENFGVSGTVTPKHLPSGSISVRNIPKLFPGTTEFFYTLSPEIAQYAYDNGLDEKQGAHRALWRGNDTYTSGVDGLSDAVILTIQHYLLDSPFDAYLDSYARYDFLHNNLLKDLNEQLDGLLTVEHKHHDTGYDYLRYTLADDEKDSSLANSIETGIDKVL